MCSSDLAERIDANLLNIPVQQLQDLPLNMYESKIEKISKKTQGKLIIKEYPTASAHAEPDQESDHQSGWCDHNNPSSSVGCHAGGGYECGSSGSLEQC